MYFDRLGHDAPAERGQPRRRQHSAPRSECFDYGPEPIAHWADDVRRRRRAV